MGLTKGFVDFRLNV